MEAVCYVPSYFLFNIAMAFFVMAPFAAMRLLVLRMRSRSDQTIKVVGWLQPA